MSFDIDDIPTIESAGKLGRRVNTDSPVADLFLASPEPRTSLLESVGVTAALQLVSRFQKQIAPAAFQFSALQDMAAAGPSYTTYFHCGVEDYSPGTCNEACYGFEPHHMDPFYCGTCAEQAADPVNNPVYNWHFVGSRGTILYRDREPDVCPGPEGYKDAWKWKVGACGNCSQSAVFRCHDGYKKYPDQNYWTPTICQGLVSCNDRLTLCP